MPRKSPYRIILSHDERNYLEVLSRKYTSPYYIIIRTKIILLAAQGLNNLQISKRIDIPRQIVSKWRKRFFKERLEGLGDLPRHGRPPVFPP